MSWMRVLPASSAIATAPAFSGCPSNPFRRQAPSSARDAAADLPRASARALYAASDFEARERYTAPELLRSNLASVILRMKTLGLGPIEAFPFVDKPRPRAVQEGYRTLFEIGAVDDEGRLTDIGHRLGDFPLDPRLGRILLEGVRLGCGEALLTIVAALSVQDPRVRPADRAADADRAHARFMGAGSDILALLRLADAVEKEQGGRSASGFRKWARKHYLRMDRLRAWQDVRAQLASRLGDLPPSSAREARAADRIHRALIPGFLTHVAQRGEGHAYHGTGGLRMHIWPGSALFEVKPNWIIAAERIETSRRYARMVAPIERQWIEPFAKHMTRSTYRDAHWSEQRGFVQAYERVVLDGLVLEPRRRVHYGPIHPKRAREVFVRQALVHGRYRTRAPWHRNNQAVLREAQDWQARLRRRDLVLDADDRFAFFDQRLPADIYSAKGFERWRREAEAQDPRVLHLDLSDVLPRAPEDGLRLTHPDRILVGRTPLRLRYRYEPGHPQDGITVTVPHHLVDQLHGERLDWLIPGWLPAKIEALLRTLPKAQRRQLIPLPQRAAELADAIAFAQGDLRAALAAALQAQHRLNVHPDALRLDRLEPHLHMAVRVVDGEGKTLRTSRSLALVRDTLRDLGLTRVQAPDATPLKTWACGDLPERVESDHGGYALPAYPALVDRGEHVVLQHLTSAEDAQQQHRAGVRRLLVLAHGGRVRRALRARPAWSRLAKLHRLRGGEDALDQELVHWVVDHCAELATATPRTSEAFTALAQRVAQRAATVLAQEIPLAEAIFERYDAVAKKLRWKAPPGWDAPIQDMTQQLDHLLRPDFLVQTPRSWLIHLPRYLDAMDARLVKLGYGELARDVASAATLAPHLARWRERRERHEEARRVCDALETYGWWLEEYRVSLFAQHLGTHVRISERRLNAQWKLVRD